MADNNKMLMYKGHPLRRKDNLIYYGSMADKYIDMGATWLMRALAGK